MSWPRWVCWATAAEAGEAPMAAAAAGAAIAAAAMVTTSPAVTGPLSRRPFIRNGVNVRCSRVMSMVSTLGIPGGGQNPADHRIGPEAPLPGWADLTAVLVVRTPETAVKAGW